MVGWIIFINPVRTLLRLAGLCVMLAVFLMIGRYESAWPYVLMGALWAVGLAIIAWILGTLCEVLVLVGGLVMLLARVVRGVAHAGRRVARWAPLLVAMLLTLTTPAAGQQQVIDLANLVQNTRTALQMVESVLKEVEIIHNQITQIENMVQNTTGWAGLWDREALPRLQRLGGVIDQEQAIAYQMADIDGAFRRRFPGYRPVADWGREYALWTQTTMDTLRGTLNTAGLHAENFATEQARFQTLETMSDSAAGRMQALQVGNMMAGEQLQQLVKLRQVILAQMNAQNVYMANQTNREAQQDATESQWIRNGVNHLPSTTSTFSSTPMGRP
ncbi:MAG TPA: P-type conjugative transfer protein TrbJ [Anaeromyxobacteraceae bacterium]|nr:P-type conjugative transfer protein TrbJ [Anaeromyxobacteraceae bacterium]